MSTLSKHATSLDSPQNKVLVVDDDPKVLEIIVNYLEECGIKSLIARNGESAIKRVRHTRPHLILLDILMPGIDGFETCRRLKSDSDTKEIPVIFMTALNETEYMIRAFSEGAVDYIIKPVKQEELLARVTTHLRIRDLTQNLQTHVEKLQKANQAFESANGELKDFAYIVSHDLKAPLRGINRLAYWFVTDYAEVINDQGKKMLELLIDRVKRMDNLIDGILKYSRIGRIIGKGEPISLYTLVHDVIDMLTPPETVQIIFSNELPEVVGDRIRMTQVFQNLLSNALKFMDKPEGKISIGCRDKGDHWTFTITDNGPGIEKKHHERIFQIFQTAQPRDIYESTGIGLSIVKKIIELYGGKIWVESVVGEGSTFFFTIPKNKADS